MRRFCYSMMILVLVVRTAGPVRGAILRVPDDYAGIQVAIDASQEGDMVLVAPGEYVITEPITFRGKAIAVKSEAGPDETTIRMGTPADPERGSVVVFENNETAASVLEGFTITGGQGCRCWSATESRFGWGGGGILFNASSGTVRNCSIVQNPAGDWGGGVMPFSGSSVTMADCLVRENSAGHTGGGVLCVEDNASVTMTNCTIAANSAGKARSGSPTHAGGGLMAWDGCSIILTNCNITENSAGHAGGGVYSGQNSSVTLTDCTIAENTTRDGGAGVICYKASATLTDCVIAGNHSTYYGGGVMSEDVDASVTMTNCIISGNSAGRGGGGLFSWLSSSLNLNNCTIWGNSAGQWGGGVDCFDGPSVAVTNSIVSGNTAPMGREISVRNPVTTLTVAYSDIAGGEAGAYVQGGSTLNWGEGNIDAAPCFADPDQGNFHLKSQGGRWDPGDQIWVQDDVTSPCIDAGDPNSPVAFEPFPNGALVNMGAYGGTAEASKSVSGLHAPYGGGTGEPNDPYLLYTAEHLNALGAELNDYDKHFKLMADIDLDPNLPGRKVFHRAVIAADMSDSESWFQGTRFEGVFDGNGHRIANLTVVGGSFLGLFGGTGSGARISNLGLDGVDVTGRGHVGGLVGHNVGSSITASYSTGTVIGGNSVGGLVGRNSWGSSITASYSTCSVSGGSGLVGSNGGSSITASYSTGPVTDGGLVDTNSGIITASVWDMETSGLTVSGGGVGLTTAEMMDPDVLGLHGFANDPNWVLDAGRDYPRLAWEGTPGQIIPEPTIDGLDGQGTEEEPYRINTADQLIFLSLASGFWDKHFILGADIDLDPNLPGRKVFSQAVIPIFLGVFDGNDHTISHLTISGDSYLGLFGQLGPGAIISNLALEAVNVNGTDDRVGGLVGHNREGSITLCCSTGLVSGDQEVGGLVGNSEGSITSSSSTGTVAGDSSVGGLAGSNHGGITTSYSTGSVSGGGSVGGLVGGNGGSITASCSTSSVRGDDHVGGLVGGNHGGSITMSCSTGSVTGNDSVGGLVGGSTGGPPYNPPSTITASYSTGAVTGNNGVGGLVGSNSGVSRIAASYSAGAVNGDNGVGGLVGINNSFGPMTSGFWDMETSGQTMSDGGTGKTTGEMQTATTFLEDGWDFIDETENGTDDIWWIDEGQDYPRLWWELIPEN